MNIKNLNLDSFIHVAEAGSFNKAAEELFITSTALIKQINQMENELEVRLFNRTHRGLTLTKAGESLYQDAKYISEYSRKAVEHARSIAQSENQMIQIGTSPIMPAQMLMDLWPKIHEHYPELSFRLVPFENTSSNAREILKNLGQNIDVVIGFADPLLMEQRNCLGLELTKEPLCCAVSVNHPLALKEKLTFEDLDGQNLMMIHPGWCESMDKLREEIQVNRPEIQIRDFDLYNIDIFNQCEQSKDVLITIKSWNFIHPLIKVIPVEWDYTIPLGILYSPQPSEIVKKFLDQIKTIKESNDSINKEV